MPFDTAILASQARVHTTLSIEPTVNFEATASPLDAWQQPPSASESPPCAKSMAGKLLTMMKKLKSPIVAVVGKILLLSGAVGVVVGLSLISAGTVPLVLASILAGIAVLDLGCELGHQTRLHQGKSGLPGEGDSMNNLWQWTTQCCGASTNTQQWGGAIFSLLSRGGLSLSGGIPGVIAAAHGPHLIVSELFNLVLPGLNLLNRLIQINLPRTTTTSEMATQTEGTG